VHFTNHIPARCSSLSSSVLLLLPIPSHTLITRRRRTSRVSPPRRGKQAHFAILLIRSLCLVPSIPNYNPVPQVHFTFRAAGTTLLSCAKGTARQAQFTILFRSLCLFLTMAHSNPVLQTHFTSRAAGATLLFPISRQMHRTTGTIRHPVPFLLILPVHFTF
jgi:hypothetical protein